MSENAKLNLMTGIYSAGFVLGTAISVLFLSAITSEYIRPYFHSANMAMPHEAMLMLIGQ